MKAKRYVNYIVKDLKCSTRRRREIRKELLSDLDASGGEEFSYDELQERIGSIYDVANKYNDAMPKEEKKKYKTEHTIRVLTPIFLFIALLIGGIIFIIPHNKDISAGGYFTEDSLNERLRKDITLLNNDDYEAMRAGSTEAMQAVLQDGLMASIREKTGVDWGGFRSFGDAKFSEVIQYGEHFAVCEIGASYENMSVIYRITYDSDMKLAGLYVR